MIIDEKLTRPEPLWQTLSRQQVLDGSPWIKVWKETLRLPDGMIVDDYYTIQTHDFALIVPFTAEGDVLILRQYRHALRAFGLSFPAGYLEKDEDPSHAARRELLEETGYGGGSWQRLGSFTVDGNRGCGTVHYFSVQGVRPIQEANSGDLEEQTVLIMPRRQVLAALQHEEIKTLPSACAFLLAMSRLYPADLVPFSEE